MPKFEWINGDAVTSMIKRKTAPTEQTCTDILKRMLLKHGVDVVYPTLETLSHWLDKELSKGEGDR